VQVGGDHRVDAAGRRTMRAAMASTSSFSQRTSGYSRATSRRSRPTSPCRASGVGLGDDGEQLARA
jgi:hypothetical protein